MFSFIILVLSGFVGVYFLFFRQSRKAKLLSKFPGPPSLPIFGNALELNVPNEYLLGILLGWRREYGNRVHFQLSSSHYALLMQAKDAEYRGFSLGWVLNLPYLTISDINAVQKILSSNEHIDKSSDYNFLMPWLGTGLLTSKGQKWFHRRKMLTPAFHFKILDDFIDVFNEQAATLVEVLKTEFGDGKAFDVFPYITRCALDIICETAMGRKIEAQREKDSEYVQAIYRIGEIIQTRMVRPWLYPNFIWNLSSYGKEEKKLLAILHDFTEKVIAEKKEEFLAKKQTNNENAEQQEKTEETLKTDDVFMKKKRRVAFLDLLITVQAERKEQADPVGPPLTDLDIREETDTFMFEGHDTTAANVNWTTFLLGCNQDCQKKVRDELDEIFGGDKERHVTTADISKMKYLDYCIKESLRLYPSVPFIARSIKKDLELDAELTIPAGTTAFIMPYQIHRDPTIYPEPELFLPDRFYPENANGRNPFAYVPFSAGPRNCIGQKFAIMEEKVVLANIFRNFKVEAAERREDLVLLAELIMRPKNGLRIKLTPRD